jgi:cytochrome P450
VEKLLAERRARGGADGDVLGRMLATSYDDGGRMTDEAIRDELLTILLAGHETTATALAWALYELGRHPAALARLRAEIEPLGADPDPDAVVKLPYLSAVCNETLRLHTLLAEVGRVTTALVGCQGYTIPAGESVCVSIMAIHHDPALYPDPGTFRPERFLERTYSPFEFLPFGGGNRRCLGAALSDYEMRIALAEIVTRWEFAPAAPEVEIRHDIAMGPKHGVPLRVTARRAPAPNAAARGAAVHA